jgi:hypothetical protein
MKVSLETRAMQKSLENIVNYSFGFLEGAQSGKKKMLDNLGEGVIQALGQYIDTMARGDQYAMHHVYEWYQTGSPAARLFDLTYTVSNSGLSVKSSFTQSKSISKNGNKPFYDKARIMELGIPVTIKPKKASALVFEDAGRTVFTKKQININDPGGTEVQGGYQRVFDSFFKNYFTQAFLKSSGLSQYISNPVIYKKNFTAGSRAGKGLGVKTGYTWIANAKVGLE